MTVYMPRKRRMSIARAERILIEHGFSPARVKLYAARAKTTRSHPARHTKHAGGAKKRARHHEVRKGSMLLTELY